jgi:hypothetical protein
MAASIRISVLARARLRVPGPGVAAVISDTIHCKKQRPARQEDQH